MKPRRRAPSDPPTSEFNWLEAATAARRRRDQAFNVEQLHQRREAWTPQAEERPRVRPVQPLRG